MSTRRGRVPCALQHLMAICNHTVAGANLEFCCSTVLGGGRAALEAIPVPSQESKSVSDVVQGGGEARGGPTSGAADSVPASRPPWPGTRRTDSDGRRRVVRRPARARSAAARH